MKKDYLPAAIVFCFMALQANASFATVITRDFNLNFTSGQLAGQSFMGVLSYDDANLTGVGREVLGPIGGSVLPEGIVSFGANILGQTFIDSDASGYPNDSPIFIFINGELASLNMSLSPNVLIPPTLTIVGFDVVYDNDIGTNLGEFSPLPPLSEPASLALFGLGLLGFGVARRRRST